MSSYRATRGPFLLHRAHSDRNRPRTKSGPMQTTYRFSSPSLASSPHLRLCQRPHCSTVRRVHLVTHPLHLPRHPLYHATGQCDIMLTSVQKAPKGLKKHKFSLKTHKSDVFVYFYVTYGDSLCMIITLNPPSMTLSITQTCSTYKPDLLSSTCNCISPQSHK